MSLDWKGAAPLDVASGSYEPVLTANVDVNITEPFEPFVSEEPKRVTTSEPVSIIEHGVLSTMHKLKDALTVLAITRIFNE